MSGAIEQDAPPAGALLTKVPGRARPRAKAMEAFEEIAEAARRRYKKEFWFFFVPRAEYAYRWRIQLECGCVHEVFTHGKDDFPDANRWNAPVPERTLPQGEVWCPNDHCEGDVVYRDIVEWLDSEEKEFPPDPEECPYDGVDAETWAVMRRKDHHSHAFWRVRLACGHVYEHVVADVGWKPEDGPKLVSEARAEEMRRDFEGLWAGDDDGEWPREGAERDHLRRMIEQRWPRPEPEQDCRTCRFAKRITGYQRIGWLMPRRDPKKAVAALEEQERQKAEQRLKKIEAEAKQLRKKLGKADDD